MHASLIALAVGMLLVVAGALLPIGRTKTPSKGIQFPLGFYLRKIAVFVYSEETRKKVFDQLIYDAREEHIKALKNGGLWKCRWIRVGLVVTFWSTVVVHASSSVVYKAFKVVK